MAVDLGGEAVDVDDLLVALGIDANGIESPQLKPNRHDDDRYVKAKIHLDESHEPDGS